MKNVNSRLPRAQLPRSLCLVLLLLVAGCHSSGQQPTTSTPTMLDVTLPDLSRMDATVQEQVRQRYQSMLETIKRPDATNDERGRAYGGVGMLLHAGEYYAAAKPAYLNAQVLMGSARCKMHAAAALVHTPKSREKST